MNTTLKPLSLNSTIGIIGAGQLGRMLAQSASQLGYRTLILTDVEGCASDVAADTIIAQYSDIDALKEFARRSDVITLEFENIPLHAIDHLMAFHPYVFPGKDALGVSQYRTLEKQTAQKFGIPTPAFWIIEKESDIDEQEIHYPVILKTAMLGYDGKGQVKCNDVEELRKAFNNLDCVLCVAEEVIDFEFEFSVILVRDRVGKIQHYPLFRNTHLDGILSRTEWPLSTSCLATGSQLLATTYAETIAEQLHVVGLLAVEMFFTKDHRILFNEIAPRPHNSGHITMDCANMSQFEAHIRAITGWPIEKLKALHQGVMHNIIGTLSDIDPYLSRADARVHLYGKEERPKRKIGHVNVVGTPIP